MKIENAVKVKAIIDAQKQKNKNFRQNLQDNLQAFQDDSEKEIRLFNKECKTCFYLKNQKFKSSYNMLIKVCKICEKTFISEDINETICESCVGKYNICSRCGQKIEN